MIKNTTSDTSCHLGMSGPMRFRFTNDYLFRATLQTSDLALKGLVCALLGLSMKDIKECVIENPIELGKTIDEKTSILDVKILLNSSELLNIELQVSDEGDWTDRSLFYLCRAFDNLHSGSSYHDLKKTIHIGILDFQLFEDEQEFYSEYKMINQKTGKVYNDKFILRVLELTQINNVPKELLDSDLHLWARLFKASDWEEVSALAEQNMVFKETASTIKKLTAEEKIQLQCEARQRYEWDRASAIDYGERRGLQKGLKQGVELGSQKKLISQVCKKLSKGMSASEIADIFEEPEDLIQKICTAAVACAPEYDVEQIYKAIS